MASAKQTTPPAKAAADETAARAEERKRFVAKLQKRHIDESTWNTLCNSVFPGALTDSILMAVDYCRARQLDVLKKPCHIVAMSVKEKKRLANGGMQENNVWRDVILPGIYEYRVTAHRTGDYLGMDDSEFGPAIEYKGLKVPEWCRIRVYRWNAKIGEKARFSAQLNFSGVVATKADGMPNARWSRDPQQMLEKCVEAAALRRAFPDELGGEQTREEMEGKTIEYELEPETVTPTLAPKAITNGEPALANAEQIAHIRTVLSDNEVPIEDAIGEFKLNELADLQFDQVQAVLDWVAKRGKA
jgi:phage recombination protein Bet